MAKPYTTWYRSVFFRAEQRPPIMDDRHCCGVRRADYFRLAWQTGVTVKRLTV